MSNNKAPQDVIYDYVFYHGNCMDGFTGAYVAHRSDNTLQSMTKFVPCVYGVTPEPPDVTGLNIIIIDYCFSLEVMQRLKSQATVLDILDHHKSNKEIVEKYGVFNNDKSGARLAYEFFFPGVDVPTFILYVEDNDLWRHALPHSHEISAAIMSYEKTFENWEAIKLACNDRSAFIDLFHQGSAILRAESEQLKCILDTKFMINIQGHNVPCVESSIHQSKAGEALCKGYPFAAVRHRRGDIVKYSLRSDANGLDVSEVAKCFVGGGGHKRAAGFEIKCWDFIV